MLPRFGTPKSVLEKLSAGQHTHSTSTPNWYMSEAAEADSPFTTSGGTKLSPLGVWNGVAARWVCQARGMQGWLFCINYVGQTNRISWFSLISC